VRVAALYDIHGNLPALEAVLEELDPAAPDVVVIGGDVAFGPFPKETVARLHAVESAVLIRGNADREVADPANAHLDGWVAEVNQWCADQLDEKQREFLRTLPATTTTNIDSLGDVLFCHATPDSDEDILTPLTPEEELYELLGHCPQRVIVCGHTHTQFDRRVADKRVVNAGSVGLPYEDAPGAYWALLDAEVDLLRTTYDFESAAERIAASSCPYSEEIARAIVSPMTAAQGTEFFEACRMG
jgi:putative phosphoesterase